MKRHKLDINNQQPTTNNQQPKTNSTLRVLQLIDSLHTGGAERVAVNIANALASQITASYLCATREEGLLKESIAKDVGYLFLSKKKAIDLKAISTLSNYIKSNKIEIIHAHSTSFFLAVLLKLVNKRLKIVWHDHYGGSAFLEKRPFKILKICSGYFSQIFSVNTALEAWAKTNLKCKEVMYLSNFAIENANQAVTSLKGGDGKRIIHLANLRPQKDHFTLLEAFKKVNSLYPEWSLHCVGKDFEDAYSKAIHNRIKGLKLEKQAFIYGSLPDISNILKQSTIAVLASKSEGLPIALLEYGLAGLPVVVSDVGDCKRVIESPHLGQLIPAENASRLSQAIIKYICDLESAKKKGLHLKGHVKAHFSERVIMNTLIAQYQQIV
ncbi:glycosyltransferase family 4 protein [Lacinutrix sp. Hel_I_90]|uniref:glycosyltransferase family 4 protein n=1 Tax=Lacinutrix sp. Hel_I_90 TaxID=1249999 RepID=UPI000AD87971|nr:glycosyltransferase family 4 protein [Lacinutrix sp. Hel_I_90]